MNLTCNAVGFPQPTYQWLRDGVVIESEVQPFLVISGIGPEERGFYQCTVSNIVGSVRSMKALITVEGELL